MKENLKKHKKKIIAFILSIFSFIPIGVNAIAVTTVALAIAGVGVVVTSIGFGTIGFANASYGNVPEGTYDERIAILDEYTGIFAPCDNNYYFNTAGYIVTGGSYIEKTICYEGTVPSITTLVDYLPYIVEENIYSKTLDKNYSIITFYENKPILKDFANIKNSFEDYGRSFSIVMLATGDDKTQFMADINSLTTYYYSESGNKINVYPTGHYSYNKFDYNGLYFSGHFIYDFLAESNDLFDISYSTNFDLVKDNTVISNAITSHEFNTDIDLTLNQNKYLMLIPKKTSSYTARIYTNNLFSYSFDYYDSNSLHYDSLDYGALTTLNMSSLGDFAWINWDINFSDLDLSSNKVIRIINPNDSVLNIKINSSDFYYKIMDSNSSSYCVGDTCYSNDFDYMYNLGNSYNYELKYNNDDYESGISFIKDIPNLLKEFVSSFAFIGTLFTTAFTIFNGSIANYFYIIFGLAIIILIFKVLR